MWLFLTQFFHAFISHPYLMSWERWTLSVGFVWCNLWAWRMHDLRTLTQFLVSEFDYLVYPLLLLHPCDLFTWLHAALSQTVWNVDVEVRGEKSKKVRPAHCPGGTEKTMCLTLRLGHSRELDNCVAYDWYLSAKATFYSQAYPRGVQIRKSCFLGW